MPSNDPFREISTSLFLLFSTLSSLGLQLVFFVIIENVFHIENLPNSMTTNMPSQALHASHIRCFFILAHVFSFFVNYRCLYFDYWIKQYQSMHHFSALLCFVIENHELCWQQVCHVVMKTTRSRWVFCW